MAVRTKAVEPENPTEIIQLYHLLVVCLRIKFFPNHSESPFAYVEKRGTEPTSL